MCVGSAVSMLCAHRAPGSGSQGPCQETPTQHWCQLLAWQEVVVSAAGETQAVSKVSTSGTGKKPPASLPWWKEFVPPGRCAGLCA